MVFLPIDIDPVSRVVKRPEHLRNLDPTSTEIYYDTKFAKYCDRAVALEDLTYPSFWSLYYQPPVPKKLEDEHWILENDALRIEFDNENQADEVADDDLLCLESKESVTVTDLKRRKWRKRGGREAVVRFRFYSLDGDDAELYALKLILKVTPVRREMLPTLMIDGSFLKYALASGIMQAEVEARSILEACVRRGFDEQHIRDEAQRLINGGYLDADAGEELILEHLPFIKQNTLYREQVAKISDEAGMNAYNLKHMQSSAYYVVQFSDTQRAAFDFVTSLWQAGKQVWYF